MMHPSAASRLLSRDIPDAYNNRHLPLGQGSRWIRVFDLKPSYVGREEPIRGNLRVVSLDSNPSYDALSYVWGDPNASHQIVCSGTKTVSVTTNCYEALQQLRHTFRTCTIWIDSICINQSDEKEKSCQVSMMQDIYGNARKVYVWLGKGNQHSDYAIDWLADATLDVTPLSLVRIAPFPAFLGSRDFFRVLKIALIQARMSIYPQKSKKLPYDSEAIKELISRAWFKRVWTIQELVMAREPIVVCGEKMIGWGNLFKGVLSAVDLADDKNGNALSDIPNSIVVAEALRLCHYIITEWSEAPVREWLLHRTSKESSTVLKRFLDFLEVHGHTLLNFHYLVIALTLLIRIYYGLAPLRSWILPLPILTCLATMILTPKSNHMDLSESLWKKLVPMLREIRTLQVTMEVDRVFALYGIFQNLGIPLQKPDYGKSVSEAYCEFTCAMIKWRRSLDILVGAVAPGLPDSPSWVPDWSTPYYPIICNYSKAAKDSSPEYSFSDNDRKLISAGVEVDEVKYCMEMLEEMSDPFDGGSTSLGTDFLSRSLHNIKVLAQWTSDMLRFSNHRYESISDVFFETLNSDTFQENKDKSHVREIFEMWYSILTADCSECSTIYPPEVARIVALSANQPLNRYHNDRCQAIAGKRMFFVTSNGYIGTGPLSTGAGDKVAILSGFAAPLILRAIGPHRQVVGAAYIHGIMQGEAWPEDQAKLVKVTLI